MKSDYPKIFEPITIKRTTIKKVTSKQEVTVD